MVIKMEKTYKERYLAGEIPFEEIDVDTENRHYSSR